MPKIEWDKSGERLFETGVDHAVLYPQVAGAYPEGYPWNGMTSVSENPEGAEANEIWADNMLYAVLRSAEQFKMTIEAYMSPEQFDACDGTAPVEGLEGVKVGQQPRQAFGFAYRTMVGSDTDPNASAYKIHLVYGCTAAPSDKDHETINDSPDAGTLSWDIDCVPVNVTGFKPTATLEFDSRKMKPAQLTALEKILYGGDQTSDKAHLPLPDALFATLKAVN